MAFTAVTVVETAEFLRRSKPLFSESERADLVAFLARNPEEGEVIPDTGGIRKIRWALEGRGKSGGARVIYYFPNDRWPLFLISVYAKNRKENLTMAERNAMKRLAARLTADYSASQGSSDE